LSVTRFTIRARISEKIQAPLLAINPASDLINLPELGILEHEVKHVLHGRTIVIPLSDKTRGHGSHREAHLPAPGGGRGKRSACPTALVFPGESGAAE
jgi:hypothetical protein